MDVRQAAFTSLMRCEDASKYSNIEIDSAIRRYGFTGNDRSLFTMLVYGVIERKISIDHYLRAACSRPLEKYEPAVLCLLRLGAYQILYTDRIPDRAAVNETVELCKLNTHKGTSGFVNAVLRKVIAQRGTVPPPDRTTDPDGYLSVVYSCPRYLCSMWRGMYGEEAAELLLEATMRRPSITLKVNTLRISAEEFAARLSGRGIPSTPTVHVNGGLKLCDPVPLSELPELESGLCYVEDEASQLCAATLGAKPGELVLDVCAAPGGKSFAAAIEMQNTGRVISCDLYPGKLTLISKGAQRMGLTCIEPRVADAAVNNPELNGKADRVICDVPCSGLGVIAKKPDLRYKSPDATCKLPELQYAILNNCSAYVRPGGRLVYSTCTLNRAENEDVAARFAQEHPEFLPDFGATVCMMPYITDTDGFFIAAFDRNND